MTTLTEISVVIMTWDFEDACGTVGPLVAPTHAPSSGFFDGTIKSRRMFLLMKYIVLIVLPWLRTNCLRPIALQVKLSTTNRFASKIV